MGGSTGGLEPELPPEPHPCTPALHRLSLFQKLLWVLGLLAGLLFLLLGLGAFYTWRWVQSWGEDGVTSCPPFPSTFPHVSLTRCTGSILPSLSLFLPLLQIWELLLESSLNPSCCSFLLPVSGPRLCKERAGREGRRIRSPTPHSAPTALFSEQSGAKHLGPGKKWG